MNTSPDYCIINNKIVKTEQATVSLDHFSLFRGYGVFESLKTYNQTILLFNEHFNRLNNSAQLLNIHQPLVKENLKKCVLTLMERNNLKEARIQILLLGKSLNESTGAIEPTSIILTKPIKEYPKEFYSKGITLGTLEYQRYLPKAKTTSYIPAIAAIKQRNQKQYFGFVYTQQGTITEAATSNIFIVKKNTLVTPKENILLGETRNVVLMLAKKHGIPIEERPIEVRELQDIQECFLTATNKEVLPVKAINSQTIGIGKPGPLTQQLHTLYKQFVTQVTT